MKEYYKVEWMTQEFLKETFTYCESGNLIWRHDRPVEHFATIKGWKTYMVQRAGIIAGKIAINERERNSRRPERDSRTVQISYKGTKIEFLLHRLIFLYHHGYVPDYIDHIDGNYLNNSIENLQPINNQLNSAKARHFSHNTTGYRGVTVTKLGKYEAQIKVNGKHYGMGHYMCPHYAALVYNYVSDTLFGENGYKNIITNSEIIFSPEDEILKNLIFFKKHLPALALEMSIKYGTERKLR